MPVSAPPSPSPPPRMSREQRALYALAGLTTRYPVTILAACLALVGVALSYTATHLEFVTGRNDLIDSDKPYIKLEEQYTEEFGSVDQFFVVVEPQDIAQGKAFVARLGELLVRETAYIEEVFYQIDTTSLDGKKLLYLPSQDLRSLFDDLSGSRELVHEITTTPGLNTLFEAINHQIAEATVSHLVGGLFDFAPSEEEPLGDDPGQASSPQPGLFDYDLQDPPPPSSEAAQDAADETPTPQIGFLNSLLYEMDQALSNPAHRYRSPWEEFFGDTQELSDEGFLVSGNRRFLFMLVQPAEPEEAGLTELQDAIVTIRRIIHELRAEFPGLDAGLTGIEVLDTDEMTSAQSDAPAATLATTLGIGLLYLIFFQRIRHPVLILSSLLVGLCWTMGFVTLAVGHLTIISVFVAPLLLGLADDFGVHFMTRYEEERGAGRDPVAALHQVAIHTGPSIIAGACTTALAFAAIMLADFRGMQELGLMSSVGILLALLAMFSFLPALIVVVERIRPWRVHTPRTSLLNASFAALGRLIERRRRSVLALAGVLTVASLAALPTVRFDYDLLNLQAHGTPSVEWERRIIAHSERASWNALATATSPQAAVQKATAFEALPVVETVESVASFIPADQDRRLPLVRALQPLLADLPPTLAATQPVVVPALRRSLDQIRFKVRESNEDWDPENRPTESELSTARARLKTIVARLQDLPEAEARAALGRFQADLFQDFADVWSLLRNNIQPAGPITMADIPPQLKKRFVSRAEDKFLLQIYPKHNIREQHALEAFIRQLRELDPDVTGSPVIGYESIRAMQQGYIEAAIYALVAIVLVTFGTLRRVTDTLLALLPLGLGMVWAAGLMWLCKLQFNVANLVAAPLIIGIGIENGIHLVHRFREDDRMTPASLVAGSTGQAVALFSLTTMVGFGSLMIAKYYGVFSMGLLLSLAVGSVLVASLVVLPMLLTRPAHQTAVAGESCRGRVEAEG